jgi:hypothetical protein
MLERLRPDEFLTALISIVQPLAPLDLPLLDAHGATLAEDIFAGERLVLKVVAQFVPQPLALPLQSVVAICRLVHIHE